MAIAAVYAWSPLAILLSAHHGNHDPVYAMLALLAVYLIDRHNAWLLAGLVLGAAINVKVISAALIPVIAAIAPDLRRLTPFAARSAADVAPFLCCTRSWPTRSAQHGSLPIGGGQMGREVFLPRRRRQPQASAVAQTLWTNTSSGQDRHNGMIDVAAIRPTREINCHRSRRLRSCDLHDRHWTGFAIQYLTSSCRFSSRRG